jgi:hypothetical protein
MSDGEGKRAFKMPWITMAVVAVIVLIGFWKLGAAAGTIGYHLVMGWFLYAARVVPEVSVHWPGIVTAGLCLVLLGLGTHSFMKWLYANLGPAGANGESPGEDMSGRRWKARWTVSFLSIIVLMFAVGICMVGIAHQTAWLFGKEPLVKHEQRRTYTD